jgi:hypothetical protein
MFGCGLPVFTASYPCISELVLHGVNGLHFSTSAQLAEQLESVFLGFPSQSGRLKEMQVIKHLNSPFSPWPFKIIRTFFTAVPPVGGPQLCEKKKT